MWVTRQSRGHASEKTLARSSRICSENDRDWFPVILSGFCLPVCRGGLERTTRSVYAM